MSTLRLEFAAALRGLLFAALVLATACSARHGPSPRNKPCLRDCDRARFACSQGCDGSACQASCERDAARCEDRCRGRR